MASFGVWRSLVAHLHGVQGVEGSNPFTPTILNGSQLRGCGPFFMGRGASATDCFLV